MSQALADDVAHQAEARVKRERDPEMHQAKKGNAWHIGAQVAALRRAANGSRMAMPVACAGRNASEFRKSLITALVLISALLVIMVLIELSLLAEPDVCQGR